MKSYIVIPAVIAGGIGFVVFVEAFNYIADRITDRLDISWDDDETDEWNAFQEAMRRG